MHKRIFKDVELATGSHKERLKRQKLGFNTRKFRRNYSRPQIKKVDGDVVMLFNNTIEQKNGETSIPNSVSLVDDQTLDGQLVIAITNETFVEEDGGQVTWIPCNIPFV